MSETVCNVCVCRGVGKLNTYFVCVCECVSEKGREGVCVREREHKGVSVCVCV